MADEDKTDSEAEKPTVVLNWLATLNIRSATNYVNALDVKGESNEGNEPGVFQSRRQIEFLKDKKILETGCNEESVLLFIYFYQFYSWIS